MFDKQFLCFEEDKKKSSKKPQTLKCNDYLKESRESSGRNGKDAIQQQYTGWHYTIILTPLQWLSALF